MIIINIYHVGSDLDEAITTFIGKMLPDGTWINTDSLIKAVESFIACQLMTPTLAYQQQTYNDSPSTVTVVHRLGEPMDDTSCNEQSELLENLRKENQEKTERIKELEAREQRFVQQIDKLEEDIVSLKAQFERYCANMHCRDNASTTTSAGLGHNSDNQGRQTSASSSTVQQERTSPDILSQAVIEHFNTLGIDLRKFFNQMEMGDEVLKPFNQLPIEFQRNKSTKAARCKRLKLYGFMKDYPGGPEACISHFHKLTASQLYDKEVKQSR